MKYPTFNAVWRGETCALFCDGRELFHCSWHTFDEIARALWRVTRGESTHEHSGPLEFRSQEDSVLMIVGKWSCLGTKAQASALASGMHRAARGAELANPEVVNRQIADGALLARVGAPFGLTDDPKIRHEIGKVAATDNTLRRAIPGSLGAKIPGVPKVRHISNGETLKLLHGQFETMRKDLYG